MRWAVVESLWSVVAAMPEHASGRPEFSDVVVADDPEVPDELER
jgi:hypothetical protein